MSDDDTHTFSLFGDWSKEKDDDKGSTTDVLKEKIFSQDATPSMTEENDMLEKAQESTTKEESNDLWGKFMSMMGGGGDKEKSSDSSVDKIIMAARDFVSSGTAESKTEVNFDLFRSELDIVMGQMKNCFHGIEFENIDPISFMYYLEKEDEKKNPSWKRRLHRFYSGLEMDTVFGLNDALYFAELAYTDSTEDVQKGLENYDGDPYELVYATVEGKPREPAHFLAIKKEAKQGPSFPWSDSFLEVLLVVRGTKEITDMISDALLDTADYRDGKAHDGILKSGKWLVDKHLPLLNHLLEKSKRKKIKLTLIGHSLGAGAASIACIEFNEQPDIEATCIGFGCPALVGREMSESLKDTITTIISDSDCIPRMSGATLANLLKAVSQNNWKDHAMEDIQQLVDVLGTKIPMLMTEENKNSKIEWAKNFLTEKVSPKEGLTPREVELYPPGKCIHFYRDGVGVSAVEVPCTLFNELDVTRTMVDDHLIDTGYNRMLTEVMRSHKKDSRFCFKNDALQLRAEKKQDAEAK